MEEKSKRSPVSGKERRGALIFFFFLLLVQVKLRDVKDGLKLKSSLLINCRFVGATLKTLS